MLESRPIPYGEDYIEQMFVFWYNSGRIPPAKLIDLPECPKDQLGRIPVRRIVEGWLNERGWRERGDVLDARAATQIEDELVALKVNALRKQAAQAAMVRERAAAHIEEFGFDSSASAVSAFIKAAELERLAFGISKTIAKLAEMDDDELMQVTKELAERADIVTIDAEEISVEDAEP